MAARLILNADDFGLTPGINRAIAELHAAGVLTSTTLMPNGPAFADAIAIAHANPTLGIGCHIVLTDGTPVSPPETIPTLLASNGATFRPSLPSFLQALLSGQIAEEEVAREALAQIQKLQHAGIQVTHLDTHKHTHLFPAISRPLLRVAEQTAVPGIRNPFEPRWSLALRHGSLLRRLTVRLASLLRPEFESLPPIRQGRALTTNGTIAISATGHLDSATLAEVLNALPSTGTFELCCHPGYNDADLDRMATILRAHREVERLALLTEVSRILTQPNAPTLINYSSLAKPSPQQKPTHLTHHEKAP